LRFWAGFRRDLCQGSAQIAPPAGRRPAGDAIFALPRQSSGRNPALKRKNRPPEPKSSSRVQKIGSPSLAFPTVFYSAVLDVDWDGEVHLVEMGVFFLRVWISTCAIHLKPGLVSYPCFIPLFQTVFSLTPRGPPARSPTNKNSLPKWRPGKGAAGMGGGNAPTRGVWGAGAPQRCETPPSFRRGPPGL